MLMYRRIRAWSAGLLAFYVVGASWDVMTLSCVLCFIRSLTLINISYAVSIACMSLKIFVSVEFFFFDKTLIFIEHIKHTALRVLTSDGSDELSVGGINWCSGRPCISGQGHHSLISDGVYVGNHNGNARCFGA